MATTAAVLQIAVKAETARARAELAATDAHVKRSARTADTATGKMRKSFASVGESAEDLREHFVRARGGLERLRRSGDKGVLHAARVRAASKEVRGLADELVRAERSAAGFTRSARGADRGSRSLVGSMGRANTVIRFLGSHMRALKWGALIGGLALAGSAAVALTSALGPTVGLLGALPGLAVAGASALGAMKLASFGLADALSASRAANSDLADTSDAARSALDSQRAATEQVRTAKMGLAAAQRSAKVAQEALTQARADARRELDDMRLASERAHLTERRAVLSLKEARRDLNDVQGDPKASRLELQDARLRVKEANADLHETRVETGRARKDFAEANRQGVQGMAGVVDARRSVRDANRDVSESSREVTNAEREAARAGQGVKQANQGMTGSAEALKEKMNMLAPATRRFAQHLISLQPKLDQIRQTAAKGLWPGVQKGIDKALQNFPVFNRIIGRSAKMMGGLAERAGDLVGRKAFGSDLEKIANANTDAFDRFGRGGIKIVSALRHVAVVARPLTKWLSKLALGWAKNADQAAEAGRKSGKMAEFFDKARNRAELLGRILGNVGKTLFGVGNASENTGKTMLQEFERTTAGWAKWTNSLEGQNQMKEWFAEAKGVMDDIWAGIGRVIDRFQQLRAEGQSTGAALGIMLVEGIEKALPVIASHAGRLGLIAIREFAKAWWHSDISGKLLLGTVAAMKLGLFAGLGQKAAGKFLGHFIKQKAATEGGASMAGSLIGGFRTRLGGAKDKIKNILKSAFANVKTAGAAGVSAAGTVVGNLVSDLMPRFKGRWAKIKEIMKRLGRRMGLITGATVATSTAIAMVGGEAAGGGVAGLAAALGSKARKFRGIFRGWGQKMGKFAGRGLVLGIIAGIAIAGPQIVKALMKIRDDAWEAVTGKKRSGFDKAVEGQPGFDQGAPFPLNIFKQKGGIVPGSGSGDKKFAGANVEPGEGLFVLNRNAMGTLSMLNAMFPRFAKGGEVGATKATKGKPGKGAELTAQLTYSSALASERKAGGKSLRAMEGDLGKLASTAEVKSGDTADSLRKHIRSGGKDGSRFLELYRKNGDKDLDGLRKSGGKSSADLSKEVRKHTNDAQKAGSKSFDALRRNGSRDTDALERVVEKSHRQIEDTVDKRTDSARKKGTKAFDRLREGASKSVSQLTNAVFTGLSYIDDATNKALKAFEVKPVKLSVPKPKKLKEGGDAGKGFATGGMVVPGAGSGDKVPMRAMVEPGERVFVLNKNASKEMGALKAMNAAVPRLKGGGGLDFALGPYNIPPIKYDAGHAGGNSHVHVTGQTRAWVVAIGKQMQKMGWDVGEHPAFGGVNFEHSATGGHYDALAIDANTAQDETRAQVAKVAKILGGKGIADAAKDIPRILVEGTKGPLRDLAQASIDKMRKGANKYIASKAPMGGVSGDFAGKGQFSPQEMAKLWIAAGGAKRLAHIMGAIGMAESGGVAGVTGGGVGGDDGRGLWQIEWPVWASQFKGMDPTNPEDNAKMAIAVHKAQGLGAWVVYQTGAYRKYMKEGGELPFAGSFANGGIVPGPRGMPQSAIVHGGERIGSSAPAVNITFADGMGWLADFIQVEIEGAAPGIAEYTLREGGKDRSRSRQLAQAGRY